VPGKNQSGECKKVLGANGERPVTLYMAMKTLSGAPKETKNPGIERQA
jgi:hypothetical protein